MKKRIAMMLLGVSALSIVPLMSRADTVELPTDPATYVDVDSNAPAISVWTESNGLSGLQKTASVVNGIEFGPDHQEL